MKKVILTTIGGIVCLLIGGFVGCSVAKQRYDIEKQAAVKDALDEVHTNLQIAAHKEYMSRTHNVYGEYLNEDCAATGIVDFVSTILDSLDHKRYKEGTLFILKDPQKECGAIFYDKGYYASCIKKGIIIQPLLDPQKVVVPQETNIINV